MTQSPGLAALARQSLLTDQMLGVDFVPVRAGRGGVAAMEAIAAVDAVVESDRERAVEPVVETVAVRPVARMNAGGNAEALQALRGRHDAECPHCTVVTTHTQTVFGEGDPNATLMFVGEAQGVEEDRTGRPCGGRAGKILDEIIKAMGFERGQVYIANILKSRPPENRTPLPNEVDLCAPFLAEQIRIIRPRVIVALGGPSAKWLLKTEVGITKLRGIWGIYEDGGMQVDVMPTFHPAYLLRNYTTDTRQKVWSDMKEAALRAKGGG